LRRDAVVGVEARVTADKHIARLGITCALCHSTVDNSVLHDPAETGSDPVRASRLKNHKYRTTPLRALWQHPPYFHDGSLATLADVVAHYDRVLGLGLSPQQQADLVEYLKSL
jgi:cytochrome c peroxidase